MQQIALLPQDYSQHRKPALAYLSAHERPSYRAATLPAACTNIEILAALIGGPRQIETAQALMEKFVSLRGIHNARTEEIQSVRGVGKSTAERIKAALALGIRAVSDFTTDRPVISSPSDAANLVQYEMAMFTEEHLWVLNLNTRNEVVEITRLYQGSVNSSQVRIAELFQTAIRIKAKSIILAHNHPSGDPAPSPDDVAVTRAAVQAGKMLDIDVLDHLVIGQGRWVSLKERGLAFT
jgi:DNA repair protein RadC